MVPDDLTLKSAIVCPVPPEQQPLNEYQELQASSFFCWPTLPLPDYIRKLVWIWVWAWVVAGPVAAASFSPPRHPVQFFLLATAGAGVFLLLTLLRLYLGWSYIHSRLTSPTVFYEESGWYDGQAWQKPSEVLTRDRLVVTYQVNPILRRLYQTFGSLAIALVVGGLVWHIG
ncbi:MAG: CGLD27 family protein [Leptolyngbyaceae cyanobacterium]